MNTVEQKQPPDELWEIITITEPYFLFPGLNLFKA